MQGRMYPLHDEGPAFAGPFSRASEITLRISSAARCFKHTFVQNHLGAFRRRNYLVELTF